MNPPYLSDEDSESGTSSDASSHDVGLEEVSDDEGVGESSDEGNNTRNSDDIGSSDAYAELEGSSDIN
ncbi:hypothetical protein ON010_g19137 [Phytophthora cinnamomi]|nr:hypothetical protein ON010_g19137 [Phytophthora cinnamomi]